MKFKNSNLKLNLKFWFLIFPALISCDGKKHEVPPPQEVATSKVEMGKIEREVLFTGNIVAKNAYDVFPRATGKISKKILKEGDEVKKGQAILLINRDEIGFTFKPLQVDSPTDGMVGSINVDIGTNVSPQNPVATVVQPGSVRVKLDVPERYLETITTGTEVSMIVDSLGGEKFTGAITTKSPVVSEKTRTANIEIEVQNPDGKLRHGMFGRLKLAVERHEGVIVIPNDSISWEGDKQFVYKVIDGKTKRTRIMTGIRNDVHVEVKEGLSEGDVVVTGELIDLKDGESVVVNESR